jgi:hypothetical protein
VKPGSASVSTSTGVSANTKAGEASATLTTSGSVKAGK